MIDVAPLKDSTTSHPVATAWRPAFTEVVRAFAEGDFQLSRGVPSVAPIQPDVAAQIQAYVRDYGESLIELPEEAWSTSISHWMWDYWEVVVDLWTAESGRSDMILLARVYEAEKGGVLIEVNSVHVP
jgi:hypothetical protein